MYWKAANQRLDNRADAQFQNDIDFGADHPTTISPQELGILSRWIDLGVPGGEHELQDTQKPTLNLAATVNEGRIIGLKIGSTDVGSGIHPDSLIVCIQDKQRKCQKIQRKANAHEIVTMKLHNPITDVNTEIEARVKDLAGNMTHVKWTAGWLIDNSRQTH